MFAVSSLQDHPWLILILISLMMAFAQLVDGFNDRAVRPIPGAGGNPK